MAIKPGVAKHDVVWHDIRGLVSHHQTGRTLSGILRVAVRYTEGEIGTL